MCVPRKVNLGYVSKVLPESMSGQMNLILELEGIQFVVKPFVMKIDHDYQPWLLGGSSDLVSGL